MEDHAEALGYQFLSDASTDAGAAAGDEGVGGGVGAFIVLEGGGGGEEVEGEELGCSVKEPEDGDGADGREGEEGRVWHAVCCSAGVSPSWRFGGEVRCIGEK